MFLGRAGQLRVVVNNVAPAPREVPRQRGVRRALALLLRRELAALEARGEAELVEQPRLREYIVLGL